MLFVLTRVSYFLCILFHQQGKGLGMRLDSQLPMTFVTVRCVQHTHNGFHTHFPQQWSPISKQGNWPKARWYHAACCLNYGEEHPQLLVSGGERSNEVLQDCWILNVDSGNWEEVSL